MGDPHNDDLAQPAVELGLEPRGADEIEPDRGQRRGMQQQLVDVDQGAAPAGADLADQFGKLGMIFFLDIGDAGHDACS